MASNIAGVDACAAVREIMALEPTPIIVALDDDAGAESERTRLDARDAGAVIGVTYPPLGGINEITPAAPSTQQAILCLQRCKSVKNSRSELKLHPS